MQNLWKDSEAEKLVEHYAAKGVDRDLALRVYSPALSCMAAATPR